MNSLRLLPIRALRDNYIWLVADAAGHAVVVDPGDAAPVMAAVQREQLSLRAILLTHHHPDHVAGVTELVAGSDMAVYAPVDSRITTATHRVGDGDRIEVAHPATSFTVIGVPGHTSSHVAFHGHDLLFCGDTLFSVGCGRMFEGTAVQMLGSLDRLAALPDSTRVCCGHEYTAANCAFALSVDPANPALLARNDEARALQERGKPSVPSTIAAERACNPFLRVDAAAIIASLASQLSPNADRVMRFAALRKLKDDFRA